MTTKTVRKLFGAAGAAVMASAALVAGAVVPANASEETSITIGEFGNVGEIDRGTSVIVLGTLWLNGRFYGGGSSKAVADEHGNFTQSYSYSGSLPTGNYEYKVLAANSLVRLDDSFSVPRLGCRVADGSGEQLAREENRDASLVTCSFTITQ
ncbi:hypothetical protein [Luethyella okanaganae]|uniref:Uncharacterized protein n=1 Tax=Luethyella okanaganae TaxID=69372 RepID=A0ABW1VJX1_9MICO